MDRNADAVETIGHEWREIKDLPKDWRDFCRDDLRV